MIEPMPAVVTLHVWGVATRQVPSALLAMGLDRRPVRRTPGLTFAKLLGTGNGQTFTPRDADPHHWGLLACWSDVAAAEAFESSPVAKRWDARATERLCVTMKPLTSKGSWAGQQPFGNPAPAKHQGPIAAVTRARIKPSLNRKFWGAVPPVSARLHSCAGLITSFGIGEAPLGLQGTFSLWESATALRDFAHRSPEHQAVISQTNQVNWYAEELFARFAVVSAVGSVGGKSVHIVT